jgi:hypothetical protein
VRVLRGPLSTHLLSSLLSGVLLLSCAAPGEDTRSSSPAKSPVSSTPSPGSSIAPRSPVLVTPRAGLVDARPQVLERIEPIGERSLLLRYTGGVESCFGLDHVDVAYGRKRIIVTLFEGRVPTAEVCIEVAVLKATRVRLTQPIGGRNVVDGAARA